MSTSKMILPEFEHEMANTRQTLERVPDDKFDWKPHEKSMTLGGLATHLANIPSWTKNTFEGDELDIAPPGAPPYRLEQAKSRAEVLEAFDKNVANARAALEAATDENWQGKWSLLMTGKVIFTLPRTAVMRGFILSHSIHHRAQLGVYLRLLDIPVPSIYGPSADEGGF
ncbi:MAG TPA: DinB family protein [Pyrinomonadaceae bacterium]|nr:DinB family protein [Pyrinomonadaceae bacterium]